MNKLKGVALTKDWFEKAVPEPTNKNLHVQIGVHFEEILEFVESLDSNDTKTAVLLIKAEEYLKELSDHLKMSNDVLLFDKPLETIDGLLDQIVTAVGVGHMLKYQIVEGLDEVNASNFSKFVDGQPIFNEKGKIIKGPNYFKPDLIKYL